MNLFISTLTVLTNFNKYLVMKQTTNFIPAMLLLLSSILLVNCVWECKQKNPQEEPHKDPIQYPHIKGNGND